MRNQRYDDIDDVPNLSAREDDDDFAPEPAGRERTTVYSPDKRPPRGGPGTGGLWAVVLAVLLAFAGLAWWSFQQITLMEQQLVATQESFARISEEAAGRLQDISGRVTASQSANADSEALKTQIRQLQDQLAAQNRQQQDAAGSQGGLDKRVEQLASQSTQQQAAATQVQDQLKGVANDLAALKASVAEAGKGRQDQVEGELKNLAADVAALKKQGNPSQAIERLEQDMVVLKSEQDNRSSGSANTAEFDAFRGQVTRNISTLQSQVQTLSQQINGQR